MDEVKGICVPQHLLEQHNMMRELVNTLSFQTQRAWTG
jgi:hypothetical protein